MKRILCVLLTIALMLPMSGCFSRNGLDSTQGDTQNPIQDTEYPVPPSLRDEDAFLLGYLDFAVNLLQEESGKAEEMNLLLSPLSAYTVLAMTANGAQGETRQEFEQLLAYDLTMEQINRQIKLFSDCLPSEEGSKLSMANSIWMRQGEEMPEVKERFLQDTQRFYQAQVYPRTFDEQTREEINHWVNTYTDGMIPTILDEINPASVMYLINALAFDAQWEQPYREDSIKEGRFQGIYGEETARMMTSSENLYLENQSFTGFMKPYLGDKYRFVALLPREELELNGAISTLTPQALQELLANAEEKKVIATVPEFENAQETLLNETLQSMGLLQAFSPASADFSGICDVEPGDLVISRVLQKCFLKVDAQGTEAGASTMVEIKYGAMMEEACTVKLNRPFLYMIVETNTNLPVFVGTLQSIANTPN